MQCIYEGEPPRVIASGCVRRIWQQLVGAWLAATTLGCFQVVDQQLVFSAFQRPRGKTPGFAEVLADDTGANSCLRLGRSMPDDWLLASFASLRNDDPLHTNTNFPQSKARSALLGHILSPYALVIKSSKESRVSILTRVTRSSFS
jgi:hypothetical protein